MGIVRGTLKTPTRQVIANSVITFNLFMGISNPDGQFLKVEKTATTNPSGFFTIDLEPGAYQVTYLDSRESFKIILPDDGTYDISELRPNPTFDEVLNPTQLLNLVINGAIEAHNLDPLAHPNGDGSGNLTEYNFSWGDPTPINIFTLTATTKIILITVNVNVAFNTPSILAIGSLSSPELLHPFSSNNLQAIGQYEIYPNFSIANDLDVYLTMSVQPGTNQGSGTIIFELI